MKISPLIAITIALCAWTLPAHAQFFAQNEAQADSIYQINIRKSRINGVYIPKTLDEALNEIKALSSKQALLKFQLGTEDDVARGLHFGLGRWIRYNWNLESGSRIGHLLKEKYHIYSPEDQSDALIRMLHRQLNEKPLDLAGLAEMYKRKWNTVKQEKIKNGEVLSTLSQKKVERP